MVAITSVETLQPIGETDHFRNKSYAVADIDRIVEDLGVFITTLANFTSFVMKVGQKVEAEFIGADGTAVDPSKLRDVAIIVPAGQRIQALVTVKTAATDTFVVMNIEDLD